MANPDGKHNTKNSNNHGCKMDFNGFTDLQNYFNGITPALKLRKATNIAFKHNNFRVEMQKYCYQTYLVLGVLSLRIIPLSIPRPIRSSSSLESWCRSRNQSRIAEWELYMYMKMYFTTHVHNTAWNYASTYLYIRLHGFSIQFCRSRILHYLLTTNTHTKQIQGILFVNHMPRNAWWYIRKVQFIH